ncbi:hypothetical protein K435DRAFT_851631 [Dendrothele bispora CBS 962.96]|uniref:Uncharacterized protein n=1 Tax=Dendrothele bispora (strain CBS 962.96) TaxID=1314807 RepID=A0A4S8MN32_DENBC|nr:hypothetical protein K435DRAFT_851631 [Dendrothele bispora CBS 962.96]
MKRGRDSDIGMDDASSSSALSSPSPSPLQKKFKPLPPSTLLVSLPSLIIHPPTHRYHAQSLWISLQALRRCLRLPDLSPQIECRAWTALAEIGMIIVAGEHEWAEGIEAEIEEATTQGLMIAQKHPTLRSYRPQLTFLAAQLAMWQNNVKFARTLLRKLLPTFLPTDPPHIVYTAHLKYIEHLLEPSPSPSSPKMQSGLLSPAPAPPKDIRTALTAIQAMQNLALKNDHTQVILLTRMIRLRILVSTGIWEQVSDALVEVEEMLGLFWASESGEEVVEGVQDAVEDTPRPGKKPKVPVGDGPPGKPNRNDYKREALKITDVNTPQAKTGTAKKSLPTSSPSRSTGPLNAHSIVNPSGIPDRFRTSIILHVLIIGVIFYSYAGKVVEGHHRLTMLHDLLDKGALKFKVKPSKSIKFDIVPSSSQSPQPSLQTNDTMDVDDREEAQQQCSEGQETEELSVIERAACGIVQIQFGPYPPTSSTGSSQPSSSHSSPHTSSPNSTPPLTNSGPPPLYIQTTHPRTLFILAYLVSCIAKLNPVGRNPKRKLFAKEGLVAWEREVRRGLEKQSPSGPESAEDVKGCEAREEEALGPEPGGRLLSLPYSLPPWATSSDVDALDIRMLKIKADLMCELVGISVMRCEFRGAEEALAHLISHLRTYGLWESFSARVTLFYAYLTHARGDRDEDEDIKVADDAPERENNVELALKYYRTAEFLALERGNEWVALAASAGTVGIRIGIFRRRTQKKNSQVKGANQGRDKGTSKRGEDDMDVDELPLLDEDVEQTGEAIQKMEEDEDEARREWDEIVRDGRTVSERCRGMGGTMWSVGRILEGCLSEEIISGKNHFRSALNSASAAGDTHLKTLVCALIASYYFHTCDEHALSMLAVSENLAG